MATFCRVATSALQAVQQGSTPAQAKVIANSVMQPAQPVSEQLSLSANLAVPDTFTIR
jgi:hypothetical protein